MAEPMRQYCTISAISSNTLQHTLQHSVQHRCTTQKKLGQTKCVCKIFSQGPFEERRIIFHREPRNAVKYNVAWRVAEGVAMRDAVDPYAIQKEVKFGSQKEMGHGSCLENNSLSGVLYVCAPMD